MTEFQKLRCTLVAMLLPNIYLDISTDTVEKVGRAREIANEIIRQEMTSDEKNSSGKIKGALPGDWF